MTYRELAEQIGKMNQSDKDLCVEVVDETVSGARPLGRTLVIHGVGYFGKWPSDFGTTRYKDKVILLGRWMDHQAKPAQPTEAP